jgi:hypothetical protein
MQMTTKILSSMKGRVRLGLAVSGLLAVAAALLLRRKQRGRPASGSGDSTVEDFTVNQEALLRRVREIWNEYGSQNRSAQISSESA